MHSYGICGKDKLYHANKYQFLLCVGKLFVGIKRYKKCYTVRWIRILFAIFVFSIVFIQNLNHSFYSNGQLYSMKWCENLMFQNVHIRCLAFSISQLRSKNLSHWNSNKIHHSIMKNSMSYDIWIWENVQ